jgi:hypothetical protein
MRSTRRERQLWVKPSRFWREQVERGAPAAAARLSMSRLSPLFPQGLAVVGLDIAAIEMLLSNRAIPAVACTASPPSRRTRGHTGSSGQLRYHAAVGAVCAGRPGRSRCRLRVSRPRWPRRIC